MRNDFDPESATTAEDSGGHRRAVTARKTMEDSAGERGATLANWIPSDLDSSPSSSIDVVSHEVYNKLVSSPIRLCVVACTSTDLSRILIDILFATLGDTRWYPVDLYYRMLHHGRDIDYSLERQAPRTLRWESVAGVEGTAVAKVPFTSRDHT
ncbi:hypothetical protein L484_019384 [Morus notabilis]|uniref:Uncharacterized protein n=1 Tax=Morus notabilis TaxID=981085 RepID=W9S7W7_9ROSA|nr:hypothetical protein L484_019384 [Morus notabilis]